MTRIHSLTRYRIRSVNIETYCQTLLTFHGVFVIIIQKVFSVFISVSSSISSPTGQFWNIPITTEVYNANKKRYIVTVSPVDKPARRFISDKFQRTWDKSKRTCFYAGNSQGGRSGELKAADDSVIEGRYSDYRVSSLYAHEYTYAEFDADRCTNPGP